MAFLQTCLDTFQRNWFVPGFPLVNFYSVLLLAGTALFYAYLTVWFFRQSRHFPAGRAKTVHTAYKVFLVLYGAIGFPVFMVLRLTQFLCPAVLLAWAIVVLQKRRNRINSGGDPHTPSSDWF